jgi:beta-mannosidase
VHLDLLRAGLLEHPNRGFAEREQAWVGRTDWRYERQFEGAAWMLAGERVRLCLCGVDTVADIELNGEPVGRVSNAFESCVLEVASAVRPGANLLAVTIRAPVTLAEAEHRRLGRLPHNGDEVGWTPFHMLRKPAYHFGWDWGPRTPTSGIAGGVSLSGDPHGWEIAQAPRVTHLGGGEWRVAVGLRAGGAGGTPPVGMSLTPVGGSRPVSACEVEGDSGPPWCVRVRDPDLWWPSGHGGQALYTLELTLGEGRASTLRWRIGFRTVGLDTSADAHGSACTVLVNGRPVFCRGANWIPDALFPTEATPARVRDRVRQAAGANMNMLRVWGGGCYEQDPFYDACDELGILVWQDFMFACALYPERALDASVRREAEQQVERLASHPSLALWCGGNECIEGYQHWGWGGRLAPGTPWGLGLWTDTLPGLVGALDPSRPYWPNSPWSGAIEDVRDADHGDRHTWDLQFEDVRKIVPRFVSEFGRIAPACERTLREAGVLEGAEGAGSWPCNAMAMPHEVKEALEHRLRQTGGSSVAYDPVLPEHFRYPQQGRGLSSPRDLRAWLWQTQVLQARALTTHIEWLRANSPRCMGALVWQLNDCWACQSWSLIDSGGRPKPAWYAVRRAFAPRLLTVQPMGQGGRPAGPREALAAVLVNDTDEPVDGECRVRRVAFVGGTLAEEARPLGAPARGVASLAGLLDLVGQPADPRSEALVVEWAGLRSVWWWGRDRELDLPGAPLAATIVERGERVLVRLHARALARDVILATDLLGEDARGADNCFTMLAGESREIEIEGADRDPAMARRPGEVVRCASGPAA